MRVPAVEGAIGTGRLGNRLWYAKFQIAIDHKLSWNVVQALGHVLNYISIEERLPTIFMPVSPPPYLNGGPNAYLSWVIETTEPGFSPADCVRWLEERLPQPVDDPRAWMAYVR